MKITNKIKKNIYLFFNWLEYSKKIKIAHTWITFSGISCYGGKINITGYAISFNGYTIYLKLTQ